MNPADEFWDWSLDVYDRDGVKPALLTLQDRYGYMVNAVLWSVWAARRGYRLTDDDVRDAMARVVEVDRYVVYPVRSARRFLTGAHCGADADLQAGVRKDILKAELSVEKLIQHILAAALPSPPPAAASPDDAEAMAVRYFTVCGEYLETPRLLADERGPHGPRSLFDDLLRATAEDRER